MVPVLVSMIDPLIAGAGIVAAIFYLQGSPAAGWVALAVGCMAILAVGLFLGTSVAPVEAFYAGAHVIAAAAWFGIIIGVSRLWRKPAPPVDP